MGVIGPHSLAGDHGDCFRLPHPICAKTFRTTFLANRLEFDGASTRATAFGGRSFTRAGLVS
jgi:hypothetical protein